MKPSRENRLHWLPPWQIELINRYPMLYREPSPEALKYYAECGTDIPEPDDFTSLRYGFEGCYEGWAVLLDELSATATSLVQALRTFGFQFDATISAKIVREKMGVLSWTDNNNLLPPFRQLWFGYVSSIRSRSSSTCQLTGKYGELRNVDGWLMTLSQKAYDEEMMRRTKLQGKGRKREP